MGFSALKTPPSCNCSRYAGKPDRQADMRLKTTPVTSRSDEVLYCSNVLAVSSSESKSLIIRSPSTNLSDKHDILPGPALFALLFGYHDTHNLHQTDFSYTPCAATTRESVGHCHCHCHSEEEVRTSPGEPSISAEQRRSRRSRRG
jgi:hypothetical protein